MKRRVLILIESLSGGGAEKVLSVLMKHFDHERYEVTVCPVVDVGVYREEIRNYVWRYCPIITYNGNLLRRSFNRLKYKLIYSLLPPRWVYEFFVPKSNEIEIAFCEGYVTKLLSHSGSKAKKIAWVHTDLSINPWPIVLGIYKNEKEELAAYSKMDRIICVSHSVEMSFNTRYGFEDKTCTIYNPIDFDDIKRKASESFNMNDHEIREGYHLVSIGRLVFVKGYDRLMSCVKRLRDDGYALNLTIIGEGPERITIERFIKKNNISDCVRLIGFVNNPYPWLAAADFFVCSSRAEGFSLVIAEAMALGIPVISTLCSGPNELLGNGKFGVLVDNSEEGLYQGIKKVFDGKYDTKELVQLAMGKISDFASNKIVTRIDGLLNEIYTLL